jgi:exosortase A-associated hydrolase 2
MNPFYFGTSRRRLFGIYTPARTAGTGTRAVVLCHPCCRDYLLAHRSMRQLTTMLCAAGFHVLRFDYFGTGDSAGDMTDADLQGWQADIEMAIEELKDTTGAKKVGLVGLRVGAALAARVAAKRSNGVDSLVLWDPVVAGEEYLQELHRAPEPARLRPAKAGGGYELQGFALTDALLREMTEIDVPSLVPQLPARTLLVCSQALSSHEALREALRRHAAGPLPIEFIESKPAWVEDPTVGAGAIPVTVLQRIVEWHEQ